MVLEGGIYRTIATSLTAVVTMTTSDTDNCTVKFAPVFGPAPQQDEVKSADA
jgi:hypothetical protein